MFFEPIHHASLRCSFQHEDFRAMCFSTVVYFECSWIKLYKGFLSDTSLIKIQKEVLDPLFWTFSPVFFTFSRYKIVERATSAD